MTIFHFDNYKELLSHKVNDKRNERGYMSKLAQFAGIHSSFLSQVLRGQVNLSSDQALAFCEFWDFDESETDYFLTLVQMERAGTAKLRQKLRKDLVRMRHENQHMRLHSPKESIPDKDLTLDQSHFIWSDWYHVAVLEALHIPELRTAEALANHFCLPLSLVQQVLEKAACLNLATRTGDRWTAENVHIKDIGAPSRMFHVSTRQRANFKMSELDKTTQHHYTLVQAIAREDIHKIKLILDEALIHVNDTRVSQKEEVVCLCLDFFRM
jgi:uncharacterized protein (TIGR02147 family)